MKTNMYFLVMACMAIFGFITANGQSLILPTTNDNPLFSGTTGCTGTCPYGPPFAEMGNGVNFDIMYVNTGAHITGDWYPFGISAFDTTTWVTDFEGNNWNNVATANSISNWIGSNGTTATSAALNTTNDKLWDPDVVQYRDSLYAIYYTIDYSGPSGVFPGNGSTYGGGADDYDVWFHPFQAGNPPSSGTPISLRVDDHPHYIKNPNIDVNVLGDVIMTWQEVDTNQAAQHIYVKAYDRSNGLYSTIMDIDPDDFGYSTFYNPDVAVGTVDSAGVSPGDHPVFVTFMAEDADVISLLVYVTNVGEVKSGASTTSGQLYIVDTLEYSGSVTVGSPDQDYLYRPRVAAHPEASSATGIGPGLVYNIVVANLNDTLDYATHINSYTFNSSNSSSFTKNVLTSKSVSSIEIGCSFNYEPCTAANQEGYEIVWNNDGAGYWASAAPNNPLDIPTCQTTNPIYEQMILRKTLTWNGGVVYPQYSQVPQIDNCCIHYGPSVAGNERKILSALGTTHTFYGFHYTQSPQETYYKISEYFNTSLKRNPEAENQTSGTGQFDQAPAYLGYGLWAIFTPEGYDQLEITDMNGRILVSESIEPKETRHEVNLDRFPSTMYTVSLKGSDTQVLTHKILNFE